MQLQHQAAHQQPIVVKHRCGDRVVIARDQRLAPINVAVQGVEGRDGIVAPNNQLPPPARGDHNSRAIRDIIIEGFPNILPGQFVKGKESGPGLRACEHDQE